MIALPQDARTRRLPPLTQLLYRVTLLAWEWENRKASRRGLRDLPDHLLRDIGVTRWDAVAEAQKPFWKE